MMKMIMIMIMKMITITITMIMIIIVMAPLASICHVIGARSRGYLIIDVQFELFVTGYP